MSVPIIAIVTIIQNVCKMFWVFLVRVSFCWFAKEIVCSNDFTTRRDSIMGAT